MVQRYMKNWIFNFYFFVVVSNFVPLDQRNLLSPAEGLDEVVEVAVHIVENRGEGVVVGGVVDVDGAAEEVARGVCGVELVG